MQFITRSLRRLLLAAALVSTALADQVTLKNGDRISGVIEKADGKTLVIKSEFAGLVTIQYDAVTAIDAGKPLTFGLKDGQTIVGTVSTTAGKLEIRTETAGTVAAPLDAVTYARSPDAQKAYEIEIERLRNPRLLDLWNGFLESGIATTRGNAKTTTINLGANATRVTSRDKLNFNFTSLYANNRTSGISLTTANAIRGGVRYDLNISKKFYGFGFTDLEYDQFQKLDLRFVPGGGLGYKVFTREKSFLTLFGGGSLNKEFFSTGLQRSSGELLGGNELNYQINKITLLQQKLVFYPNISNTGVYRINFDVAAITKLGKWLSWQIAISDRFLSNPVPGAQKNDILFTSGVRLTFAK